MTGRIKFYNRKEGYGFITGDDGRDYFLSYKNIPPFPYGIGNGYSVEFTPRLDDRGYFAEDLKLIV